MEKEQLQSQTISFLRFPLIVLVIFIHSYGTITIQENELFNPDASFSIYSNITYFISQIFAAIAVPLFFLISGFLYFYKMKEWSKEVYLTKTKKRIRSLLIPYLFWNLLALALFFTAEIIPYTSDFFSGKNAKVSEYSFLNFVSAFWNNNSGTPFAYQFWFIRDLIIACLLSPLIYLIIRYIRIAGVLLIGLLWFFGRPIAVGLSPVCLFFFALGAYFSINKLNMIEISNKIFKLSLFLYPLLALSDLITKDNPYNLYIHNLGIIAGICLIVNLASYGLKKHILNISTFLTSASFFVFAIHEPWLTFIRKILASVIKPDNNISLFIVYFIPAFLIIIAALLLYKILNKTVPRFLSIINGGRA